MSRSARAGRIGALVAVLAAAAIGAGAAPARYWGAHGHRISGHAAAVNLPAEMPRFFREAAAQLEYLNPEPDRWRVDEFVAMNDAYAFDHYIDLEVVPDSALLEPDRFEYLSWLESHGLENAAQ